MVRQVSVERIVRAQMSRVLTWRSVSLPIPSVAVRRLRDGLNPVLRILDFFFYFSGPLGIELFFIGGKLAEQSQKLSSVYTFFVRYILEHFYGKLVGG